MVERAVTFERTLIGPEANGAYGTAVAATKSLLGTKVMPKIMTENKPYGASGNRWASGAQQNREWSEADWECEVAQYVDGAYLNSMLLGSPDITTPGGGTNSRELDWFIPSWSAIQPMPFTVWNGSSVRAMKFAYGLMTGLNMTYSRKDGVAMKGKMIGQKITDGVTLTPGTNEVQTLAKTGTVSGGTFTLQWRGQTTAPIAYNASAATIQTAILLLANLDSGDVVVTGGPAGTSNVIFTFGGQYASLDLPLIIVNSASLTGGGTYDITETTPGAALSELDLTPVSADDWDFYLDTSAAGLGNTKLTRCFKCSWSIDELFGPVWVGNTSVESWAAHVDLTPKTEVKFTVAADSTGMGVRTSHLQVDAKAFVRFKCTGPLIEGSLYHLDQRDFAVSITDISEIGDEDGVAAVEYTGIIAHDSTWGVAANWLMRNELTSIS